MATQALWAKKKLTATAIEELFMAVEKCLVQVETIHYFFEDYWKDDRDIQECALTIADLATDLYASIAPADVRFSHVDEWLIRANIKSAALDRRSPIIDVPFRTIGRTSHSCWHEVVYHLGIDVLEMLGSPTAATKTDDEDEKHYSADQIIDSLKNIELQSFWPDHFSKSLLLARITVEASWALAIWEQSPVVDEDVFGKLYMSINLEEPRRRRGRPSTEEKDAMVAAFALKNTHLSKEEIGVPFMLGESGVRKAIERHQLRMNGRNKKRDGFNSN